VGKIQKTIEIVKSDIPGLSSIGRGSANSIKALLSKHYKSVQIVSINSLFDLESLVARGPDLVFLGMKYLPLFDNEGLVGSGRIWIAGYLNKHGISYTGSPSSAYKLEHDKQHAKQSVAEASLETSAFQVIANGSTPNAKEVTVDYPVFIKPTSRGGGLGIDNASLAKNYDELIVKINALNKESSSDTLIEEYLSGREFSVAVLKDPSSNGYSLMPLELIAPENKDGARILTASIKSADMETFVSVTDIVIKARICTLALDAFHALGANDFGRIDIRLDSYSVPHFLEANLIPSLVENYGNFPKACKLNEGLSYEEIILAITSLGLLRKTVQNDKPKVQKTLTLQLPLVVLPV
jgi:D-alanine-D-alanine ligase